METILCATDLSESSRVVAACAASLAKALHAKIDLVHAIPPLLSMTPEMFPGVVLERQRSGAETALNRQAEALRTLGVEVTSTLLVGYPDEIVAERAKIEGTSLVVVGNHARSPVGRAFVGSVTERTVRHAACPVLVVPPSGGSLVDWTSHMRPLRVTAAIDLSAASDAALEVVQRLGARVGSATRFVHLYWPPREHERLGLEAPNEWEPSRDAVDVLTRELRERVSRIVGQDAGPIRARPSWGQEENPLAWEAETDDADILVVGTSQARHSTAIDVLRGAHLPVLCVPARLAVPHELPLLPIRHVLVTTDFSPLGNTAVKEACRLVLHGGVVTLVHVVEGEAEALGPDARNEIETCLLALVPPAANPHTIHARVLALAGPSAAARIVQAVHRVGPDLVVMSSHGRTGLARAVRGSVAEQVMRESPKPVLVVPRPRETAAR
jgi:nucleotide-binding universal stress UspA family protein